MYQIIIWVGWILISYNILLEDLEELYHLSLYTGQRYRLTSSICGRYHFPVLEIIPSWFPNIITNQTSFNLVIPYSWLDITGQNNWQVTSWPGKHCNTLFIDQLLFQALFLQSLFGTVFDIYDWETCMSHVYHAIRWT